MPQLHDSPAVYLQLMRKAVPLYDRLHDEIVRASADIRATRILDLGAGTGETTRRCLAAHPSARAVLVDASESMLRVAALNLGPALDLRHGRFEDALPPGPFDLVVSALAVHHLDGRGKADLFRRIAQRLTPDGRVVIGDVVVTATPVSMPAPLDPAVDYPDRIDDQLAWLADARLRPRLHWADSDLAVLVASLPKKP
jgi:tRNA (cmo5U34)-methyltransferase